MGQGLPVPPVYQHEAHLKMHTISDRAFARLSGPDPDDLLQGRYEYLAVSDLAGLGLFLYGAHGLFDHRIRHYGLDLHLWDKRDVILSAAVKFDMAFLSAEALHLGDRHPLDTDLIEGVFYFVKFKRFNYGFYLFHIFLLSVAMPGLEIGICGNSHLSLIKPIHLKLRIDPERYYHVEHLKEDIHNSKDKDHIRHCSDDLGNKL